MVTSSIMFRAAWFFVNEKKNSKPCCGHYLATIWPLFGHHLISSCSSASFVSLCLLLSPRLSRKCLKIDLLILLLLLLLSIPPPPPCRANVSELTFLCLIRVSPCLALKRFFVRKKVLPISQIQRTFWKGRCRRCCKDVAAACSCL